MFPDENALRTVAQVAVEIHSSEAAVTKQLGEIYKKFARSKQNPEGCPDIQGKKPGKQEKLRQWLKEKYAGRDITGLAVENVCDEWHDACLRMVQRQLTSNQLLRRIHNRDLIEDDIYVDLALVQPKRDRLEKPQPDVDPMRGSQLYDRQEVEKHFQYCQFLQEVIGTKHKDKIAIIGEPGAGKTTLLQQLAFWLLQETEDLVVWVSLRELQTKALGEYLQDVWLKNAFPSITPEIKADWERRFQRRRVWLLLDGWDEMAADSRQALSLQGWVTQARIVVSCRLNVWQANPAQLQGFETYLTQQFSEEQMQQFIAKWFDSLPTPHEKNLWEALNQPGKERIKDLSRNPLRLTLLCATWQRKEGDLPETKAQLYQKFVNYVYRWNENEKFLKRYAELCGMSKKEKECKEELNKALGELAKVAIDGATSRFCLQGELVREFLGDESDDTSLLRLALDLGWLNEVGVDAEEPEEPVYAFYHATFQEYFAARVIEDWDFFLPGEHGDRPVLDKDNPGEYRRYRIFERQWQEVILLWLGRSEKEVAKEEKEGFIQALVEFEDGCNDFYGNRAYCLAAKGISEFKQCSLADVIVQQIVKWAFGDFNIEEQKWDTSLEPIKEEARETILQTDRQRGIQEVCYILDHPQCSESILLQAAYIVGEIDPGNPQAIKVAIRVITFTEDKYIREQATKTLGEIGQGNPQAIEALVRIIASSTEDTMTLWWAAESLEKIGQGNPQAIAALVRIIKQTEDESTLWRAINSLGKIGQGDPQAIAALVKVIEQTEYTMTVSLAADSLEKIGQGNPQAIAALVRIIKQTEDEHTRRQAIKSLGEIDVVRIIKQTKNEYTRRQAAKSLGEIDPGNPQAIATLVRIIKQTKDELTLCDTAKILGEIDPENSQAIEVLVKVIEQTDDEYTLYDAAESLGKIDPGNPQAIEVLVKVIEQADDEYIRRQAAENLGEIGQGNSQAIEVLIKVIEQTEDKYTFWEAAKSLGEIGQGNPQAIEVLIKVIEQTEDKYTFWEAAKSLGEIGQGNLQAIAALVRVIQEAEDEYTFWGAASSLEKIDPGNSQAIKALVRIIEQRKGKSTFWLLANSLGEIDPGNPQAIEALVRIIEQSEDKLTRCRATKSLWKILTTNEQQTSVVSTLNSHISNETYQNNFDLFENCYELLWKIAQELPYPDFYAAWHNLSDRIELNY